MAKEQKTSECIESFLNLLNNVESLHQCYQSEISRQDKLTQDYLHKLELGEVAPREKVKFTNALKRSRQDRRYYKDRLEEIQPLYEFWQNNRKVIGILQNTLGAVRKQEKYHECRVYKPRVLVQEN
ncbi:hypothetical protein [Anaerotignum sp. MB30-C6]|uniref:hypothetical protein n=1 Tax=Anaerotignum sp. MB30-C6 TaxID=3070814 RepID=UPI0027DE0A7B|nr:hypothetical protein [Anaerotignum sp. MB30-C6]WMI81818.1 hypothetical protein RBQ60_03575 [Anaerotignum sp. MB30-C6]